MVARWRCFYGRTSDLRNSTGSSCNQQYNLFAASLGFESVCGYGNLSSGYKATSRLRRSESPVWSADSPGASISAVLITLFVLTRSLLRCCSIHVQASLL